MGLAQTFGAQKKESPAKLSQPLSMTSLSLPGWKLGNIGGPGILPIPESSVLEFSESKETFPQSPPDSRSHAGLIVPYPHPQGQAKLPVMCLPGVDPEILCGSFSDSPLLPSH